MSHSLSYELQFIVALAVTIVTETAVLLLVVRLFLRCPETKLSTGRCVFAGIFASAATLPYLWFLSPVIPATFVPRVVLGEVGVFLVETLAYRFLLDVDYKRSALISAAANAASILVGLVVNGIFR